MSQKRNTNGRKRTPGGRPGGSATATSALLVRFDVWYARHLTAEPHEESDPLAVRALLEALFAHSGGALRAPAAATLEALLTEVDADPELAPRMPEVVDVLEHYLDFVIDTGAWNPSDAALEQSEDVLSAAYMLSAGLLDFLLESLDDVEDASPSATRAAVAAVAPLRGSAEALLPYLREALTGALGAGSGSGPAAVLGTSDTWNAETTVALYGVLGSLAVAADPSLLAGFPGSEIVRRLQLASGVSGHTAGPAIVDGLLARFAADGLLVVRAADDGDRYEAPVGIRGPLADAVLDLADELGVAPVDESANPHPEGTALELVVTLADSTPAVWRRLLVDADATVAELHLAIQLSLEFSNEHPHRFLVDDEEGTMVLTSAQDLDDLGDEVDALDDDEVEIGEVLVEPGDEIAYEYDLEPGWRLRVRLERVVEAGTAASAGRLPRCIAGSGQGPEGEGDFDVEAADRMLSLLRIAAAPIPAGPPPAATAS